MLLSIVIMWKEAITGWLPVSLREFQVGSLWTWVTGLMRLVPVPRCFDVPVNYPLVRKNKCCWKVSHDCNRETWKSKQNFFSFWGIVKSFYIFLTCLFFKGRSDRHLKVLQIKLRSILAKWVFFNDPTQCRCGFVDDTANHLLPCPLLTQKCRLTDLLVYNDTAKEI